MSVSGILACNGPRAKPPEPLVAAPAASLVPTPIAPYSAEQLLAPGAGSWRTALEAETILPLGGTTWAQWNRWRRQEALPGMLALPFRLGRSGLLAQLVV